MIELFDSTITFHAHYQQRRDIPALLDLLVLDRDNPRSLGWVVQTLKGRLAKLAQSSPGGTGEVPDLAGHLPEPGNWVLSELVQAPSAQPETSRYEQLIELLDQCNDAAFELSDNISRQYFSHAASGNHSLGT